MKKLALAAMIGLISASAFAAQGDILARFRVINVNPDVKWDNNNKAVAGLNVDVKDDTVPELDFTYMITNNIGAELILGTSRHKVTTNKLGDIGKVSVLPPTLTLQYHFAPDATFRPYAGVGVNYTNFYNVGLKALASNDLNVDRSSWGAALQVGADYAVTKDIFVNFDVKKLYIKTDVTGSKGAITGVKIGTLKIDPWVFGLGIGTKF